MGDREKLFNYQLTIQKLEEELALYRNGTSVTEVLEIVREKDQEIASLKEMLLEKDETLRKIAKSSSEVILRYEEGQKHIESLMKTIDEMNDANNELKNQLDRSSEDIAKLQGRCASLVSEKSSKMKELDQERKDMIAHVQKFTETMNSNIALRDDAIKRKDAKIKELQFQISVLKEEKKQMANMQEEKKSKLNFLEV